MRSINIDQELISELTGHIREKNHEAALAMLDQFRPEDIADIFWDIDLPEAKYIILAIGKEKAVEVIRSLDAELQGRFFKGYQAREIAEDVIEYLDSDDAVDILNLLSAQKSAEVLSYLSDQQFAKNLVSLLHYDDDIAGGLMAKELIKVRTHWTMIQCVEEIRKQAEEVDVVHVVYAVDADDILLGIVSLKAIVLAKANSTVQDLVNHQFISVNAYATGEEVARLMNKYDLIAIPVVDSMGRLMGRITIDDVVDFIKEEADRDYQLQAGLSENVDSTDKVLVLS
ncbi:MAG: magnesium transporter, partial [Bacteroidia bacterium]|nr:magnesium transporter [Bacteroidia bacterium]